MAKADFVKQLRDLGYEVQVPDGGNRILFEYTVPVGSRLGKKVWLGFVMGDEFPLNCPSGPHFRPIDPGWTNPTNAHHSYDGFGDGWWYWSRPFPDWPRTDRTVKAYLSHIRNLLAHE